MARDAAPLPARIVSLVPSLTEALFTLGLGDRVVGVTEWCIHPADALEAIPRVGGTKNPELELICSLEPDLVIANREENTQRVVERLRESGIDVWVTYPRTVVEAVALLRELAIRGGRRVELASVVEPIERALALAMQQAPTKPTRCFCPIWKQPWMAVGSDTYADDLLTLCGGSNVFAGRSERRYPLVRDEDIVAAQPEVILLPDEPYAFGAHDVTELLQLPVPAARDGRIHLIDGTLVSWYGPRIGRAIEVLGRLLAS